MDYVKNIDLFRCLSLLLVVCTQKVEEFTAPYTGTYKLQCWGAAGTGENSADFYGGKGGYSEGIWKSTIDKIALYVCVGQVGIGGSALSYNNKPDNITSFPVGHSGGGATNITTTNRGELKNFASPDFRKEVLIVAGGGGGLEWYGRSGAGGGLDGKDGNSTKTSGRKGTGGSQDSGGITGVLPGDTSVNGMFGVGGYGYANNPNDYGAQGGGGWYGGGGASYAGAAGGGSSYGNSAVLIKDSYKTIDGDHEMPSPDGRTENGHTGHGACVISWILN